MFSLRQLIAFVTVAENKSFTKAARTLYMTQPAVSAQIKALEERLEICLLERNDKNISLTEAGEIFYIEAQKIIALYHGFMEAVDELKGIRKGRLCIAASTIPGEYVLPNILGAFHKLYPGVELNLKIADTGQVAEQLINRSADIGIIGAYIKDDALHMEEFKQDELIVIASGSDNKIPDVITVADLTDTNLLLREADSGTRMFFKEELKNQGVDLSTLKIDMELGSTRSIITAVQSGLGVSVVSSLSCQDALELGKIRKVKLANVKFKRSLYLAWNKNKYQSHAVKAFLRFLQSQRLPGETGQD